MLEYKVSIIKFQHFYKGIDYIIIFINKEKLKYQKFRYIYSIYYYIFLKSIYEKSELKSK